MKSTNRVYLSGKIPEGFREELQKHSFAGSMIGASRVVTPSPNPAGAARAAMEAGLGAIGGNILARIITRNEQDKELREAKNLAITLGGGVVGAIVGEALRNKALTRIALRR